MEADEMDDHALSRLRASEGEPIAEGESETATAEKEAWETDCWMYKVEPVEPVQGFPVADVMLWKEDNLMLDVEAMDDDDDDDDDHSDDQQHGVGGKDEDDVAFDYQICGGSC